ncbi:MAG: hypothetical protein ACE5MH_09845, partial [Terriglobia bacterium]
EPRVGELREHVLQLRYSSSSGFPLIHVLDEQQVTEHPPSLKNMNRVGVQHDGEAARGCFLELGNDGILFSGPEIAGRMNRDVVELEKV